MDTISISKSQANNASRSTGIYTDVPKGHKKVKIHLSSVPRSFLAFLSTLRLPAAAKKSINAKIKHHDTTNPYDLKVDSLRMLHEALQKICDRQKPNLETRLPNGKYYPVVTQASYSHSFFGDIISISTSIKICDHTEQKFYRFSEAIFYDEVTQVQVKKTVREVLLSRDLREATPARLKAFKAARERTRKLEEATGSVLDCSSEVLYINRFLWSAALDCRTLGSKDKPSLLVVDNALESDNVPYDDDDEDFVHEMPFVRVFSLELKNYVFVDVDSVTNHKFDKESRNRLVLTPVLRTVLDSVFEAHSSTTTFGDMFNHRNGGMVVLANGPSGVGKTLTAEVFSEFTGRPLYVLEMGELGTNLASVEQNLQRIFARAARWNAVLLFDEADIFLAKRQETDLERSAIVGVFLRLLDQYQGMFFLTTNREEVMDHAFKSRITLKLMYPELVPEARARVWSLMLKASNLKFEGDAESFIEVSKVPLNGRQIRNQVRLLSIQHGARGTVTKADLDDVLQFVAR